MGIWFLSGLIALIPFIPWSRVFHLFINKFDEKVPEARKDVEFRIQQAQVGWLKYEHIICLLMLSMSLLFMSFFLDISIWWRYFFISLIGVPWWLLKFWGRQIKEEVRVELADFYRALKQLLMAGAQADEAIEASMNHVKYLQKPLQKILDNWGNPEGTKETLHQIYHLYSDSDIKNMINLLESVLLNQSDETILQTMESQEELIRDLKEHAEETRDEAEKERLEVMSTLIVLAQIFMVILPVVMDTVNGMSRIGS